ncbi:hypothetical protein NPIL_289851 [Nephila pilipes]|uniref:Uncharacterized protein n=1 Tax=Nephila pilipes TaxID=299642 RepID=A0A8X6PYQ8_NEPPI|nr:hypothetical protein NPIL_289851 [Nephila pilipes]
MEESELFPFAQHGVLTGATLETTLARYQQLYDSNRLCIIIKFGRISFAKSGKQKGNGKKSLISDCFTQYFGFHMDTPIIFRNKNSSLSRLYSTLIQLSSLHYGDLHSH